MTYVEPLVFVCLMLCGIGLFALRQKKPLALVWGLTSIFLLCWPPVAWLASRPLEAWYPRTAPQIDRAQAIVVLSSTVLARQSWRPFPVADGETYERCVYAAWLYSNARQVPVLASGGPGGEGEEAYAVTMKRVIQAEGVPGSMIWTEERSSRTYENAVYSAETLRTK